MEARKTGLNRGNFAFWRFGRGIYHLKCQNAKIGAFDADFERRTNMTARELFREIRDLDKRIDQKMDRLKELRTGMSGIGGCDYSAERVQTSPSGEPPYVRRVERILELNAEIDRDIDRLVDLKVEAWKRMRCLTSRERELLTARYFEGLSWYVIAEQAGCRIRNVHYIHNKALNRMDANVNKITIDG